MKDTSPLFSFLSFSFFFWCRWERGRKRRTGDALCVFDLVSEAEEPCEPGELAALLLYVIGSLRVFGHLSSLLVLVAAVSRSDKK